MRYAEDSNEFADEFEDDYEEISEGVEQEDYERDVVELDDPNYDEIKDRDECQVCGGKLVWAGSEWRHVEPQGVFE